MASSSKSKRFKHAARKGASPCPEEDDIPSTHVSRFNSPSQYNAFIQWCANKDIIVERLFDENFLRSIDFPWLDRLIEWGWWDFICFEGDVNPNLVKVFYFCGDCKKYDEEGNVKIGMEYDDSFKTTVLGSTIDVHARAIKRFVNRHLDDQGDTVIPSIYPFADMCKIIFQDPTIDYIERKTSRMDLNTRILHLIVCQALYPRGGDFASASNRDIYLMAKIIENDPPNLAALIVRRMLEAVRMSKSHRNQVGLPYGKLVSKICRFYGGLQEDEVVDNRGAMSTFNAQSVIQMGWVQDPVTRAWTKKGEQGRAAEGEISMSTLLNELRGVSSTISTMADRMGRMESRQQSLENQIFHVNANLQALRENAPYDVPFPFFDPPPR